MMEAHQLMDTEYVNEPWMVGFEFIALRTGRSLGYAGSIAEALDALECLVVFAWRSKFIALSK